MKAPEALLQEALAIAERMHAHLARSHHQVQPHIPLQAEQVPQLDDDTIDRLDLYLSRFGKLKDYMVGKLFRALARASLEDTSQDVSLLDTLNRMEKFGVVDELECWLKARMLRNAFAHEYLTDNAAIADNINDACDLYELLNRSLANCHAFYREHIERVSG
nr:hypothetical protein [uncultured Halomonas sp.]